MAQSRRVHAGIDRAQQRLRAVVDQQLDPDLDAVSDLVRAAVQAVVAQADVVQPAARGGNRALGAVARDLDEVPRVVPAVDGLDGVRVGAGAGDRRVGVGVRDAGDELLLVEADRRLGDLILVGQVDAEAALGRGGDERPVVVQRGVDVDRDANDASPKRRA